jgi:hypothetical protein
MSISLLDGGTTATTGGTSQAFTRTATAVKNGYEYADGSEAAFLSRQKVILKARMPSLQSTGEWSKQKIHASFVFPFDLASGDVSFSVARVEIECHPEATSAHLAELREMVGQLAIQSGLDDLYTAGTFPA